MGSSDGGDDRADGPVSVPDISVFNAAEVEKARKLCSYIPQDNRWTSYAPETSAVRTRGGMAPLLLAAAEDQRSFQFTADGHWYTLVDDGDGGLKRGQLSGSALPSPGYDGGVIGYEGTYEFQGADGVPSGPDGSAVYVATRGVTWFHPEFTEPLMLMTSSSRMDPRIPAFASSPEALQRGPGASRLPQVCTPLPRFARACGLVTASFDGAARVPTSANAAPSPAAPSPPANARSHDEDEPLGVACGGRTGEASPDGDASSGGDASVGEAARVRLAEGLVVGVALRRVGLLAARQTGWRSASTRSDRRALRSAEASR